MSQWSNVISFIQMLVKTVKEEKIIQMINMTPPKHELK